MAMEQTTPLHSDDEYVTVPEAATYLHVSQSTIWRWIAHGELRAYRIGHRYVRLKRVDVEGVIRPIPARSSSATGGSPPAPLTLADPEDIWAGYDPEQVRQALQESIGLLTDTEADALIAAIYRAREAGSRPDVRP